MNRDEAMAHIEKETTRLSQLAREHGINVAFWAEVGKSPDGNKGRMLGAVHAGGKFIKALVMDIMNNSIQDDAIGTMDDPDDFTTKESK